MEEKPMLSNRKSTARNAVVLLSSVAVIGGSVFLAPGMASATVTPTVTITSLSTNKGSTAGGTNVLITGKGFTTWTAVAANITFNTVAATSIMVLSDTQIAATAPAGAAATGNVVATATAGTSATSTANAWTYLAPITAAVPASTLLNSLGGSVVTITASGGVSMGASAALFSALKITATVAGAAAPLKWVDATHVKATVPAGTPSNTAVNVALLNNTVAGTADSTNAKYTAVISKLSVVSGPLAGTGSITLTGKGLLAGTTFKLGAVALTGCGTPTNVSVTCTGIPAGTVGAVSANFVPAASAPYGTLVAATYSYTDVS
jgi:hypothetical protein